MSCHRRIIRVSDVVSGRRVVSLSYVYIYVLFEYVWMVCVYMECTLRREQLIMDRLMNRVCRIAYAYSPFMEWKSVKYSTNAVLLVVDKTRGAVRIVDRKCGVFICALSQYLLVQGDC